MTLKYVCKYCGEITLITGFWKWFSTPHFGSKKWLKCKHCMSKKHFMERLDWSGPKWLDWPKDRK